MSNHNLHLKHLTDQQLDEVLNLSSDKQTLWERVSDVSFWVGTFLAGASIAGAIGTFFIDPTGAAASLFPSMQSWQILGLGVTGGTSLIGSTQASRLSTVFRETNDQAYSLRQARDNAAALAHTLQIRASTAEHEQGTPMRQWQDKIAPQRAGAENWQEKISAQQTTPPSASVSA